MSSCALAVHLKGEGIRHSPASSLGKPQACQALTLALCIPISDRHASSCMHVACANFVAFGVGLPRMTSSSLCSRVWPQYGSAQVDCNVVGVPYLKVFGKPSMPMLHSSMWHLCLLITLGTSTAWVKSITCAPQFFHLPLPWWIFRSRCSFHTATIHMYL